ncbi:MAG: YcaO-like family protein [Sulfurovum sp.]|nr:YcaO-like family protein [Sulfurovum sp.]
MREETYIKGKESSLESTIERMYKKLRAVDIDILDVSVLNPVPFVYSQHIQDKSCNLMFTNGKGSSAKACLASALGEYFERLSCNYFFADYYLGEEIANSAFVHYPNEKWFGIDNESEVMPLGILDESLWRYFDPENELHPLEIFDLNSGAGERGICTLPFVRQSDAEVIYFPVNFIANIFVSNGMAAGNTKYEAQVQAMSEIFERYVKNKIIAEGICLPRIPSDVMNRFSNIQKSIQKLEAYGYYLRICDASLGGIYPVISVTLINPNNGSVFASFGAHPCFEVALERTVTELLQGRSLEMLNDFHAPSFNVEEVADHHNLETHFINATGLLSYEFFKETSDYDFVDWNFEGDTKNELMYLFEIAQNQNFDIYIAEYEHLGVYTCRILVPGMSDIYPIEDLVWNNNNQGAYFRKAILSLKNLEKEEMQSILENLEEAEHSDMIKVTEFIGVVPDVGTAWETLQVGELKAMLYLALGEHENAQTWVTWCNHMANLDEIRSNLYRCLHAMLTISIEKKEFTEYKISLMQMYTKKCVEVCEDILTQNIIFYGLHSPGLRLEGFYKHLSLLEGYKKVHNAKKVCDG